MRKIVLVIAFACGLCGMQRAQARGGVAAGIGAGLMGLGIIFIAASSSPEKDEYSYNVGTPDGKTTDLGASGGETFGWVCLAGGGVVLLGGIIYMLTDDSSTASLRIPLGNKRYALLNGSPVVTPRFQGVGISIKF
jgi:hypothetical protein